MAILLIIIVIGLGGLYFWHIATSVPANMRHEATQRELAAKFEQQRNDELLAELELMAQKAEVLIQADLVGDKKTADALYAKTYDGPMPEKRSDGGYLSLYDNLRILKIAGINHRQGIDRYVGRVDCALVPEPNNEFDPNAIKIVAEDRHHLGYIPTDMTDFVRSMAADKFPLRCTAFIRPVEDEIDDNKSFKGFVYIVRRE